MLIVVVKALVLMFRIQIIVIRATCKHKDYDGNHENADAAEIDGNGNSGQWNRNVTHESDGDS